MVQSIDLAQVVDDFVVEMEHQHLLMLVTRTDELASDGEKVKAELLWGQEFLMFERFFIEGHFEHLDFEFAHSGLSTLGMLKGLTELGLHPEHFVLTAQRVPLDTGPGWVKSLPYRAWFRFTPVSADVVAGILQHHEEQCAGLLK